MTRALVVALVLAFACAVPAHAGILAPEDAAELAQSLAEAQEEQDVCYGWRVTNNWLLGFSHQALVGELSETVACVPGVAGSLPLRRTSGGYDFRARVERHADEAYAARAAALIAAAADDPHALAGVFADAPGAAARRDARLPAFTALAARPLPGGGGIAWTTWHGYPQSGEIVVTASSLERGA